MHVYGRRTIPQRPQAFGATSPVSNDGESVLAGQSDCIDAAKEARSEALLPGEHKSGGSSDPSLFELLKGQQLRSYTPARTFHHRGLNMKIPINRY